MRGTPEFMSPEIVQDLPYSKEVDIWSFGCFAYELATGNPPNIDVGRNLNLLFDRLRNCEVALIPDKWSSEFKDFVSKCL